MRKYTAYSRRIYGIQNRQCIYECEVCMFINNDIPTEFKYHILYYYFIYYIGHDVIIQYQVGWRHILFALIRLKEAHLL